MSSRSRRRAKLSPVEDATWHISRNVDKDGLEKRFVDEFTGKSVQILTFKTPCPSIRHGRGLGSPVVGLGWVGLGWVGSAENNFPKSNNVQ